MTEIHVGVDVGGTKALLLAFQGTDIVAEARIATGKELTAARFEQELTAFLARLPERPAGVGVAVPGIVDAQQRVEACDVLPGLDGWRLQLSDTRTAVLNDTAAALLAAREDFAPGATAALVMVGTAIGAAFQVNGVIARGAKGWAGELGYVPVQVGGRVQPLDALAGGAAILERCGLSAAELSTRLAQHDEARSAIVAEAGRALGLGLATLVNLLNPDLIVLGGGTLAYPGYVAAALQQAEASSFPALWQCCAVMVSPHGDRLVARGAANAAVAPNS